MEYARLGQSDLSVSQIGFGCAAIGGYDYGRADDSVSLAAIHEALDRGVNFFDTADVYGLGHAEEILGEALAGRAQEAVIATKATRTPFMKRFSFAMSHLFLFLDGIP